VTRSSDFFAETSDGADFERPIVRVGRRGGPAIEIISRGERMRITITCEGCGRRHELARTQFEPGPIWLVCHGCETPLQAQLGATTAEAAPLDGASPSPFKSSFQSAWGGTIDLGIWTA
jgi:hypothetical protein